MQVRDRIYILSLLLVCFLPFISHSQVPTEQDCLGAIPICQPIYYEDSSFTGSGNYTNEINTASSCLANEDNSVWYIFTAQSSGMLSFIIYPNDTLDDWDWAVYDLTNASCSDIFSDPSIQISCNSYGNYTGWYNGPTGASSAMGGITNNNGPGVLNGPPWNADIPVIAGGTYVMLICNWTGSTHGYTLDLTPSTAIIFDDIEPYINSIDTNIICGSANLSIGFSEKILCSTISTNDFKIRGPGINPSITSIIGNNCAQGGQQERDFIINVSVPLTLSGKYILELVDDDGSVSDLCNNIASVDSIEFFVGDVTDSIVNIIHSTCEKNNGSATVSGLGGNSQYTYHWSTNPPQTSSTAVDLGEGIYYVTVSSNGCLCIDSLEILTTPLPVVEVFPKDSSICDTDSITLYTDIGYDNYLWNNGYSNTPIITVSFVGSYFVEVTDSMGCTGISDTADIDFLPDPLISILPEEPVICYGENIILTASGANTYMWSPFVSLSDSAGSTVVASPMKKQIYTVTGTDINGCTNSEDVIVQVIPVPEIFLYDSAYVCLGSQVTLSPGIFSSYKWQDGSVLPYYDVIYPGLYWVTVDHSGCIASDTILMLPCSELWVPNSFTPNGDGKNDVFKAVGSGKIKSFEMLIFNRWGERVFESNNINNGWNGTFNENPSPEGVYHWIIIYYPTGNFSTDKLSQSGYVLLLR